MQRGLFMGVSKAAKPLVKAQLLAAVNKPQTIHYQERDRSRKKVHRK